MNTDTKLSFKLSGNAFSEDGGYNLYYLSKSLSNFQTLIDKSYLTIQGKKKMSKYDREILNIKAYNMRPGSFEADLAISLATVSSALVPLATSLNPKEIWELSTKGLTYLKTVLTAHTRGENLSMEIKDSSMVNVISGDSEKVNIIQVHPDVLTYASNVESTIESIAKLIDPNKGMDGIYVTESGSKDKKFSIGAEEKMIFENRTRLEPDPVIFMGSFIEINGELFKGKLRVIEGNELIHQGDYNFEFYIKEDIDKLSFAFLKAKEITALRETTLNPGTLEKKITKLRILNVK